MHSLLSFHAIAKSRGDGLLPEITALFERLAAVKAAAMLLIQPVPAP